MADLPLYADYTSRKFCDADGASIVFSPLVLGDTMICTLGVLEKSGDGYRQKQLNIRTLSATLGKVMTPPDSGTFALKVENPAAPGTWLNGGDISVADPVTVVTGILSAMLIPTGWTVFTVVNSTPGCWLVAIDGPPSPPANLQVSDNKLTPTTFVRIRAFQQAERWWHEIELIQTALAFNDAHERVLPPPPTITEITLGRPASGGLPPVNELQDLYLPPDFQGTYVLVWNYRISTVLSEISGPTDIAAALNGMFGDTTARFAVKNDTQDHASIEFIGPLSALPQSLITVTVKSFPPGVLTFTLPLDRAEMCAALRALPSISVPFEIELELVPDGEDPTNPAIPGRVLTLAQQSITIVRELRWKEMATVRVVDWLRPPTPRDYIPYTPDQIMIGQQNYLAVIGNGEALEFSLAHNLGTANISNIAVIENKTNGRLLVLGTDFNAQVASANEVVLVFVHPPAANALVVVITSAGPISAFQAHTHTMQQIVGLLDALAALSARVSVLEELLPTGTLVLPAGGPSQSIVIPDATIVFPNARLGDAFDPKTLEGGDANSAAVRALPRPPGLLPAIHDATITAFNTGSLPPSPAAGNVYQNTGAAAVLLPGGIGRKSVSLTPNGYAGFDGRVWYRMTRGSAASNSYFPTDFELQLFAPLTFDAALWQAGQTFALEFDISLQLFRATTNAQMVLAIETGTAPSDNTPSPISPNLQNIVWDATPVLLQRVVITGLLQTWHFGCRIQRATDNTMSAEKLLQNAWSAGDASPASPSFVMRARLIRFDTEDSVIGATGYIFAKFAKAAATIG